MSTKEGSKLEPVALTPEAGYTGAMVPFLHKLLGCCLVVAFIGWPRFIPLRKEGPAPKISARVDRYGDPLPERAIARLGTVRWRHGSFIGHVAFSPDGKTLVSGSPDGQVLLWQVATGKQVRRFKGYGTSVRAVVFSPDGTMVASCSGFEFEKKDNTVRLWDTATGKELHCLSGHEMGVTTVDFSPDGKILASGSADCTIRLWEVKTGELIAQLSGHQFCVNSVAFSPDGKLLASGGRDHKVYLWDLATLKEIREWDEQWDIFQVAFSPDGRTLGSASRESLIRLRDLNAGEEIRRLVSGRPHVELPFSFCPDGKTLICSSSGTVSQIDLASGKEIRRFLPPGGVYSIAVSRNGKTLATSGDGMIPLWDIATGKPLNFSGGHTSSLYCVAVSPNGETVATASADENKAVRIWQVATGNEVLALCGQPFIVVVAYSPDGKTLATGSFDGMLDLWDATTGAKLFEGGGNYGEVRTVAFSPDGRRIASGGWLHESINFWEPRTGNRIRDWAKHPEAVLALAFSPNGKMLASGGMDQTIRFWDVATAREIRTCKGQTGSVSSLVFSPDGKMMASATAADTINAIFVGTKEDPSIRIWETATGKERVLFRGRRGFTCLAISPDGRTLASADDRNLIQLWDILTGKWKGEFAGHSGPISSVAFTPNGKILVSASCDTTALLWDLAAVNGDEQMQAVPISGERLDRLWDDLARPDAGKAWRAIGVLVASPNKTVPFLKAHLKPVTDQNRDRILRLIADLDNNKFSIRETASQELAKLLPEAEPALRKALDKTPSPELQVRIKDLLALSLDIEQQPETLRGIRAVETLESIGTSEAREILKELSRGRSGARLTEEAKASLERLARTAEKEKNN